MRDKIFISHRANREKEKKLMCGFANVQMCEICTAIHLTEFAHSHICTFAN